MRQEQKISQLLNAEELKHRLTQLRTTKERFRLPWSFNDSVRALTLAYKHEVECRQRVFINDNDTQQHIVQVVNFLTAQVPSYGILLCGKPGNGKTTLCLALQDIIKFIYKEKNDYMDTLSMPFVHARDICELVKTNNKEYQSLCSKAMLAIDDLGTEPAEVLSYGNIIIPTIELLSRRYEDQLFTIVTTNLTPKQIRSQYTDRIADRFNEMMGIVIFKNDTYRETKNNSTDNKQASDT